VAGSARTAAAALIVVVATGPEGATGVRGRLSIGNPERPPIFPLNKAEFPSTGRITGDQARNRDQQHA